MHIPAFPPRLEEWEPGQPLKEPPLPRWTLNPLPPGVTREQAAEVVGATPWARRLAEGQARKGGLRPGTRAYEGFVKEYAQAVATGMVRGIE